jgi:hypothetical protein
MEDKESHREEVKVEQNVSRLAVVITELGLVLPAKRASAQAVDQLAPRDRIALKARNDGYIEFADEFNRCMGICLHRPR